jgi:hypothetical protein
MICECRSCHRSAERVFPIASTYDFHSGRELCRDGPSRRLINQHKLRSKRCHRRAAITIVYRWARGGFPRRRPTGTLWDCVRSICSSNEAAMITPTNQIRLTRRHEAQPLMEPRSRGAIDAESCRRKPRREVAPRRRRMVLTPACSRCRWRSSMGQHCPSRYRDCAPRRVSPLLMGLNGTCWRSLECAYTLVQAQYCWANVIWLRAEMTASRMRSSSVFSSIFATSIELPVSRRGNRLRNVSVAHA